MTPAAPVAPVVLVHGAGQDAEIWTDVVALLALPVQVHELPGHGRRAGPPLRSITAMADDVAAALPTGAVVVGHSMGGAVALETALRHDGVGGVIAVCTSLRPRPDARVVAALRTGDLERFLTYVRPGIVGVGRRPTAAVERSAARLERAVARHPVDVLLADYEAVAASDLTGRLGALRVPVAVLAGERDALVHPRRVAALAAELGVEAQVVAGASHQVPWEAPAAVVAAVQRIRTARASP